MRRTARDWETEPFRDSLCSIALIGMRAAGAEGFAFFEKLEGVGSLRRLAGCGTPIPESALIAGYAGLGVIAYPLRSQGTIDGILAFAFPEVPVPPEARTPLDRVQATVASLWAAADIGGQYSRG